MLKVTARRAGPHEPDSFDLMALPLAAVLLRDNDGREYLRLADGPRHVRLELRGDSITNGPVRLDYDISSLNRIETGILTLRRLSAVGRFGHLPHALYPPDPIVARRVRALQAWEGALAGASQRDIAVAVFGVRMVTADSFDSMRKRVKRLLHIAEQQVAVAWQRFFPAELPIDGARH